MAIRPDSRTSDNHREIVEWLMSDCANSAFQTTVITVLIGPYLTDLAQRDVGRNGIVTKPGTIPLTQSGLVFPCVNSVLRTPE